MEEKEKFLEGIEKIGYTENGAIGYHDLDNPILNMQVRLPTYRLASEETIIKDFEKAFEKVDLILTPTSPFTAFRLGEKLSDPISMYLSDIFTVSVNIAGLPAISIPCGVDEKQMPVGVQLIAPILKEFLLYNAAHQLETIGSFSKPLLKI